VDKPSSSLRGRYGEVISSEALYTWLAAKRVSPPAEDTLEYWKSWAKDIATVPGFPLAGAHDPDELRETVMRILGEAYEHHEEAT
jgi:hypothetical protein